MKIWDSVYLCFLPYLVRNSEVFDCRTPDVNFRHSPESVSVSRCADHLSQVDVHPEIKNGLGTQKKKLGIQAGLKQDWLRTDTRLLLDAKIQTCNVQIGVRMKRQIFPKV